MRSTKPADAGSEPRDDTESAACVENENLLPGDAYMDGPYMVFTAQYHQRRGYCCNSGCRHCPYRDAEAP